MSETAVKAVFLSYASQDADAAKRICETLRAAGVEVWFDTDGGLEHGDEWDAKIRRQIKECVLFLPIISANTQAREEGYFRLEWDLAAERARTIASGVAFILPVVVDATREPEALVPDRFRTVQWTKLPGGTVPPEVLQRFLKLWSHRTGALKHRSAEQGAGSEELRTETRETKTSDRSDRPRWLVPAIASVVAVAVVAAWFALRPSSPPASSFPPPASPAAPAVVSEARQLVAKAWEQMNKAELARAELEVAEDFYKRAVALDTIDPVVWAAGAQVDTWFIYHGFDDTPARRESARAKAARALQLDATGFESRLAQACYLVRGGGDRNTVGASTESEARQLLEALLRESPDEPRTLLTLGILHRNVGRIPEARKALERLAQNPAFAALAWNELGYVAYFARDYREAEAAADRSIAIKPYWGNLGLKAWVALSWRGDLDGAKAAVEEMPARVMQDDFAVTTAVWVYWYRREPDGILRAIQPIGRDWLRSNLMDGPKAAYAGLAHRMAGRKEAAEIEWRAALKVIGQRLAETPNSPRLLQWKARLLAELGERTEAEKVYQIFWQIGGASSTAYSDMIDRLLLGQYDEAISALERGAARDERLVPTLLRLDPRCDPLRQLPRFQALLARLEADPRYSPKAEQKTENREQGTVSTLPPDAKSVAVLPLANSSGDPAQEYFSDGLTEAILEALQAERDLRVPGRASCFAFKGKAQTVPEIARALNVAQVVEGSVRRSGNQVRITISLTRGTDGISEPLGTFTKELVDGAAIFALQDEVAGAVVAKLTRRTTTAGGGAVPTRNPAAHDAYLRGRAAMSRLSQVMRGSALEHFHEAVRLDPDFALAWAQLAEVLVLQRQRGVLYRTEENAREARQAAANALRLGPDLPEAHFALARVTQVVDRDLVAAGRELDVVERLRPGFPELFMMRSELVALRGDWGPDLVRRVWQAVERDPQNYIRHTAGANGLSTAGWFADAARLIQQVRAAVPADEWPYHFNSINLLRWTGDVPAALAEFNQFPADRRDQFFYSIRGDLLEKAGDFPAALANYEAMGEEADRTGLLPASFHPVSYRRAVLEARRGRPERAAELYAQTLKDAEFLAGDRTTARIAVPALVKARLGQRAEALALLDQAMQRGEKTFFANNLADLRRSKAEVHVILGQPDEAIATLRSVLAMGYGFGYTLRLDPTWEPLRGDPKFQQLMKEAEARADAQPRPKP